ncbi:MAG: hypothetical protein ACM30G_21825 [Micromonosporaceae bacterium]
MTVRAPQEKTRRSWLRPESVAVRWLVVLATVIGAVAAAIPLVPATARWWHERTTHEPSMTAGATIEQGSAAADALVRQLFNATGGRRLDLDVILNATPSQAGGKASNGFTVFYNCTEGPDEPGADRCGTAKLYWESNPLPFEVRGGTGWHLVGTYTVALDAGKGQVYDADLVAFHLSSVTG